MDKRFVVLENEYLSVDISTVGAELKRIYGKQNGIDYLWQGNLGVDYWQKSATLLFPFVGRLQDGIYKYDGKEFQIGCHGFVKGETFSIEKESPGEVIFSYSNSEGNKKSYPFDFKLNVSYTLDGMDVKESVIVENKDSKILPFKMGFHPGFNVPLEKALSFEDYDIVFENAGTIKRRGISERGLETGVDTIPSELDGNTIHLNHEIFKNDALVLCGTGGKAEIRSLKSNHSVTVSYDSPWCGIWQTYKDDTPFVAIEPWYNLPGKDLEIAELEKIEDIFNLAAGEKKSFDLLLSFK